ncbi:hypothetical protein HPB48_010043 [Haemaphysalis longicornis]|uniref:Uncharacterized protein n=1 Tax=Haemaphysalis longicornis TaxID=44386 RepID=A0A9J6F9W3_HAELO|nr:hypothetical protein HPB48_010043 [Haemaphysalis longicornis]
MRCWSVCLVGASLAALMVTPAASKDVAASGDLAAQDLQLNESALAALGAHLGYNVLGAWRCSSPARPPCSTGSRHARTRRTRASVPFICLLAGWLGGGNQTDEDSVGARFEAVLRRYNVDPDACLKVAMCSVGRLGASSSFSSSEGASSAQAHGKQRRQAGPVEVFDSMLR